MLSLLKIKNLALVDQLTWELGAGLVGVTGETGAGKSVIVGALKLVLGERADKGLIRTGETECRVEALFELNDVEAVNAILEEAGFDQCEGNQLLIRRVIGIGSNKQFVNDSPATLGVLKKIGEFLVDLHGPHDHQSLLSPERQMAMLDAYADCVDEKKSYREAWRAWRQAGDILAEARKAREIGDQEKDLLRFQMEEIQGANLKPGEEIELEEQYRRTANASRLQELSAQALKVIDGSINNDLTELQKAVRDLVRIDPSLENVLESLESVAMELGEIESSLRDYYDEVVVDPEEAQRVEERFNLLESLKRKYGPGLEDVAERGREAAARLEASENREGVLARLETEVSARLEDVLKLGKKMSLKRKKNSGKLAAEIRGHLADLGFKQGEFEVELTASEKPSAQGLEDVDFLFGPNPGEPLKPLKQVASSGEISRVMLAIKNALADQDATPLMVFDEIDANVGGEIARAVGQKMAALGERHQVVSITHFPQVAAVAQRHFVVEKKVQGGRTLSSLYAVEGEARVAELVRMLGGGGAQAEAMARALLVGE